METHNSEVTRVTTFSESIKEKAEILRNEPPTAAEIQAWITSYLGELLEIEPDEVNVAIPFDRYGLDSSAAVGLTGDLEDWLEIKIDPTLLYDYPTVEGLSRHLAEEFKVSV